MADRSEETLELDRGSQQSRDPGRADAPTRERPPREREDRTDRRGRSAQESEEEQDKDQDEKLKKSTRWPLIALGILIVIAAIGATVYWYMTKDQVSTDDAYTDGRAVMISPHVAGYVTVLAVNDNQLVRKGDLLVQIEPKDYVAARDQAQGQLDSLVAQLDNARLVLDKARITYPAQLPQAEGQLRQASGQMFQTQREFQRQQQMTDLATTQAARDSANSNFQTAAGQTQQAQAQVNQAKLVQQNIDQAAAQVRQLEGQVEQARGNLEEAKINLDYTRVTAPQDGWVTKRNVEVGDYLQPGQQITALVVPEVWVTANFKETQLARMRPGQRVKNGVDALPQLKLRGHVGSVQLGSGSRFTAFPPENATGNFVKIVQRVPVKIVIDSGLDPQTPLPLGISVEPTVLLK
jgi:membrane fusion protein (multidrug efflux system)